MVKRGTVINFGTSKFIAVRLISLLYYDRHFHVRMDVALIGVGTPFLKRERKGTTGGNDSAIKRRAIVTRHSMGYWRSILPGHGCANSDCQRLRTEAKRPL